MGPWRHKNQMTMSSKPNKSSPVKLLDINEFTFLKSKISQILFLAARDTSGFMSAKMKNTRWTILLSDNISKYRTNTPVVYVAVANFPIALLHMPCLPLQDMVWMQYLRPHFAVSRYQHPRQDIVVFRINASNIMDPDESSTMSSCLPFSLDEVGH